MKGGCVDSTFVTIGGISDFQLREFLIVLNVCGCNWCEAPLARSGGRSVMLVASCHELQMAPSSATNWQFGSFVFVQNTIRKNATAQAVQIFPD